MMIIKQIDKKVLGHLGGSEDNYVLLLLLLRHNILLSYT